MENTTCKKLPKNIIRVKNVLAHLFPPLSNVLKLNLCIMKRNWDQLGILTEYVKCTRMRVCSFIEILTSKKGRKKSVTTGVGSGVVFVLLVRGIQFKKKKNFEYRRCEILLSVN